MNALLPAATPPPLRLRWTTAQFHDLCDTGVFDGRRVMLIDGEILTMPLPNPPHNLSLGKCDDRLRQVFATGFHIRNQMALDVGTANDPGPDLAVVAGRREDYSDRQPDTAALVVEVADSSLFLDTTTKAELYARAGVPEYWVVDLENRQLIVLRDPQQLAANGYSYQTKVTLKPTDSISPLAAPTATIKVSELLA